MASSTAVDPQRIDEIEFLDRKFIVGVLGDGFGYVTLNSLCDAFGLDRRAQRQKIDRNSWYYDEFSEWVNFPTEGGVQKTFCLRADSLPIFLTNVNLFQVKDKENFKILEQFIRENHIVLAEYWGIADREQIMVSRQVIERLIMEHAEMEGTDPKKVKEDLDRFRTEVEETMEKIRVAFSKLQTDVKQMQQWVGPTNRISPEQGAEIQHKIKQLAELKIEYMNIASPYGAIYGSMYKRFSVTSYKEIKMSDYPHVLKWLDDEMDAVLRSPDEKS